MMVQIFSHHKHPKCPHQAVAQETSDREDRIEIEDRAITAIMVALITKEGLVHEIIKGLAQEIDRVAIATETFKVLMAL